MSPNLATIRDRVNEFKGSRVRYKALKGRRKMEERMAVIVETYPHLFTLYVESQRSTVSFSYAELLTREVEMEILPGNKKLIPY
ncbi:MAG: Veg family protein [Thermovirgaceae bacterium]|nr:Veg family protein [Synergistales bacterium]HPC76129.1 Veg family protein [Synergistales bacterium]HRS48806.1 Veg family protein [Thermovirgaceae bacterium]HRU91010.1 Veg family protein [Thermovirgaceae bacterium]